MVRHTVCMACAPMDGGRPMGVYASAAPALTPNACIHAHGNASRYDVESQPSRKHCGCHSDVICDDVAAALDRLMLAA